MTHYPFCRHQARPYDEEGCTAIARFVLNSLPPLHIFLMLSQLWRICKGKMFRWENKLDSQLLYISLKTSTHPNDSVPKCHEGETKKESKEAAEVSNKRSPLKKEKGFDWGGFSPRIEQLLMLLRCRPCSR